jgi:mRNA interferase MazF
VDVVSRLIAERFDVYMVRLDPAVGAEVRKTRPCVVVSPNQMHRNLYTVIIVPMTGTLTGFPTRIRSTFGGRAGELALDQMRAVDFSRLGKRLGRLDAATARRLVVGLTDLLH